ncbi:MAG: glycosyltransferase WbpL [Chloroflexota bacterium]|nr:glycosyltransferase WbpL [Chloroflexota bacterium]
MITAFAVAAVVGFGVSFGVAWLVARNASRLGLLDVPNERSSHQSSTPRGGGLGIIAGVAAGLLVLVVSGIQLERNLVVLLAGAAAIAVLGAIDDRRSIPARYRIAVQLAVAIVVVILIGGVPRLPFPPPLDISIGWVGIPVAVLWLAGVTNFYNFMDGIDGLAAAQAVASCAGIVLAVWAAGAVELAFVLAAAAIGFLILNSPPARIFLGDVGSTSVGFAIAGMPLLAPTEGRPMALFAVAIGLSLFLLDPLETLVRLMRGGHRIGRAHRAHSYQALAPTRSRHRGVTAGLALVGLVLSLGGALAYHWQWLAWPILITALAAFGVERFLAGRARGAVELGRS